MRRGNPPPITTIDRRPHLPFHRSLTIVFDGALIPQDAPTFFRSQGMETHGLTLANCFFQLNIKTDTNPGQPIALFGTLVQMFGAAGADSPIQGVSQGIPGFGKAYVGVGSYSVPAIRAGSPAARNSLAESLSFELRGVGGPAGRVVEVDIDGHIVAGAIY